MAIKSSVEKWADGQGPLDAIYHGDDKVWPKPPLSAQGMSRSGSQSISGSFGGSANKLTGFTPQAGTSAANVVDDGLVVNGEGSITVSATASHNSTSSLRLDIYLNGVRVSTGTSATSQTWTGAVKEGDRLELYVWSTTTITRTNNSAALSYAVN